MHLNETYIRRYIACQMIERYMMKSLSNNEYFGAKFEQINSNKLCSMIINVTLQDQVKSNLLKTILRAKYTVRQTDII
jgi:hypothetical protein